MEIIKLILTALLSVALLFIITNIITKIMDIITKIMDLLDIIMRMCYNYKVI